MVHRLVVAVVSGALLAAGACAGGGREDAFSWPPSPPPRSVPDPCPALLGVVVEALAGPVDLGPTYPAVVFDAGAAAGRAGCDLGGVEWAYDAHLARRDAARAATATTASATTTSLAPTRPPPASRSAPGATGPPSTGSPSSGGACRTDGADVVLSGALTDDIDGDSFVIGGVEVRLSIVNTPEWDEHGGTEATRFTVAWFGTSTIDVYRPAGAPSRDKYGRVLGDVVRRRDCSHLAVELVRTGHGEPMAAYCHEDPWLAHQVNC